MALATGTLTYSIGDLLGAAVDFSRSKIWLETNMPGTDVIVDTAGKQIRLGTVKGAAADGSRGGIAADGTGSFTGLPLASVLAGLKYQVHVAYPNATGSSTWDSGWFSFTAAGDLSAQSFESTNTPVDLVGAAMQAYVDEAQAAAQEAQDISGISTSDDVVKALVADPASKTAVQLSAAFAPGGTAGNLSVASVANARARLAARAGYDAAVSNGRAQTAGASSARFTEAWGDLSQWAVSGTSAQVSGGKLYGTTGAGGLNHSWRIAPGITARAVFKVDILNTGSTSGQGVLIGINRDGVGAAPSSGGAHSRGFYFRHGGAGSGTVVPISDGTQGAAIFAGMGDATFTVTLTVDENYLSMGISASSGGAPRVVYRWTRDDTNYPINNLSIMVNDARGLTGSSVEAITEATIGGSSSSFTSGLTPTPSNGPGLHWGSMNGDNFLIQTPIGYDSRKPTPAALVFHGNGSDETHWLTNANGKAVADALTAAGFIVIAAANTGGTSTWGSDAGLNAYSNAYHYARDHYNLGPLVFYANSMGGIESLNVLARDVIPGVAAWAGTSPTFNLTECHANAEFTSTIDGAYGGNFAANAVGHDPAQFDPFVFRGVPMWMLIATDDVDVTPSANGEALYAAIASTNPRTRLEVTGGHSTTQIAANANTIVSFFQTQIGYVAAYPA